MIRMISLAAIAALIAACGAEVPADAQTQGAAGFPNRVLAADAHLTRITGDSPYVGLPGCGPNEFFGHNFEGAEVEPMIEVSPANPQDLIATWFQDASLAYATAVSRNGGRTWQTVVVPGTSACDGGDAEAAADPWLAIGPDEAIYLAGFSVYLDALPVPLPTRTTLQVSRGSFTRPAGVTWSAPVVVQSGAGVFHDRPIVSADPTRAGAAYVLWNDGTQVPPMVVQPLMFAATRDGGASWSPPALVHLPPGGITHEGKVLALPDGSLLATYLVIRTNPVPHQIYAKRSVDGGRTWPAAATLVAEIPAGAAQSSADDCRSVYSPIRDAEHGSICIQMPEQELSSALGPDGSVYLTWRQAVADDHSEIRVARSIDGGATWEPSRSVSAAQGEKAIPAVAVAGDGTVGVSWYDFRSDVAGDVPWSGEVWFAKSRDAGASWEEQRVAGPFDMRTAPYRAIPVTGLFLGDYHGLVGLTKDFGAVYALPAPYAVAGTTDLYFARIR